MEMKNYFKIGEGVKIDVWNKYMQQRVKNATLKKNKKRYITFYPTYVTTGHMFDRLE
jgi:hypothetical protein